MDDGVKWASLMAVVSALGAVLTVIAVLTFVHGNFSGSLDIWLVPPAAIATALLGGSLWWILIERPHNLTNERAIVVGSLVGLLSHPLMWALYILGSPMFLPGDGLGPSAVVDFLLIFSILSVLYGGVLSAFGGIICGLFVLRCRNYVTEVSFASEAG